MSRNVVIQSIRDVVVAGTASQDVGDRVYYTESTYKAQLPCVTFGFVDDPKTEATFGGGSLIDAQVECVARVSKGLGAAACESLATAVGNALNDADLDVPGEFSGESYLIDRGPTPNYADDEITLPLTFRVTGSY